MDGCNARTTLGVSPNASITDIKVAYRALAKRAHPDRGGDAATFDRLTRAYELLIAEASKPVRMAPPAPTRSVFRRPMWTRAAAVAVSGSPVSSAASRPQTPGATSFAEHLRRASAAA